MSIHAQTQNLLSRFKRFAPYFIRDNRLRSGWRVALYLLASFTAFVVFAFGFGTAAMTMWLARGVPPDGVPLLMNDFATARPLNYPEVALAYVVLRAALALGIIWGFRKWIDRRPFFDLGFQVTQGWWRELAIGFILSFAIWLVIFAFAIAFGGATIVGFGLNNSGWLAVLGVLVVALIFNLLVGVAEEADARGYILQTIAEGMPLVRAILIASLYFGVLHLLNPGGGLASTIGVFVAGILLAVGYYITRRLWLSIGMHAGWNFAQGPIFGFPVSGLDMSVLTQLKITGPDWLMGGKFGPEAGALAVIAELGMIALLLAWKQGRLNGLKEFWSVFSAGWGDRHFPR